MSWPIRCARTGPGCGRWNPDSPATVTLRATAAAPAGTWSPTGSRPANQLRAHLQRRASPAPSACSADLDSPISLAFLARFDCQDRAAWLSPRRLAAWLASVGYCGRTDPAALHARLTAAPPRGHRRRRRRPGPHHPRPAGRPDQPGHPDQGSGGPDRRAARAARRRAHLHLAAPLRDRPRRPAARRDRRLPGPLPDPRIARPALAGVAPVHPPVRQASKPSAFRWACRQTAPRRGHRLRRRQPPRQPLGRTASTTSAIARGNNPPPRRPHPRPRLALRHLALLARPHQPTTQPATTPSSASSPSKNRRQLDTGLLMPRPRTPREPASRRIPVRPSPRSCSCTVPGPTPAAGTRSPPCSARRLHRLRPAQPARRACPPTPPRSPTSCIRSPAPSSWLGTPTAARSSPTPPTATATSRPGLRRRLPARQGRRPDGPDHGRVLFLPANLRAGHRLQPRGRPRFPLLAGMPPPQERIPRPASPTACPPAKAAVLAATQRPRTPASLTDPSGHPRLGHYPVLGHHRPERPHRHPGRAAVHGPPRARPHHRGPAPRTCP